MPTNPSFTPSREELAWAAGFFDGEGCFSIQTHKKIRERSKVGFFGVVTQIAQAGDPFVLHRFRDAVGGLGKVKGPYRSTGPNGPARPKCQFSAQSFEHTQQIVNYLWPWLSPVKKEQAKRVLTTYTKACEGRKTFYKGRRSDGRCAMGHAADERRHYGCLGCIRERQRRRRAKVKAERAGL